VTEKKAEIESQDRITANLPARDLGETAEFFRRLGFQEIFRDEAWMIMRRGSLELEFFPHPKMNPATSWASACVRVNEVDALFQEWSAANLPKEGIPRLTPPEPITPTLRAAYLVDCNGSLLRIIGPIR
jgi:hypothetical protein